MNTFRRLAEMRAPRRSDQDRARPSPAPFRRDADGLDVADESASHVEDEESGDGSISSQRTT